MTREELLKVAKPCLFNTEMTRAILKDRKSVTRRLVKLPKNIQAQDNGLYTLFGEGTCYENQHLENLMGYIKKPCQPDDVLYVRETWQCWRAHRYEATADIMFRAGGEGVQLQFPYGNTDSINRDDYDTFVNKYFSHNGEWKPSLFMPKEVARIFLKVTDIHIERLQDITEDQAYTEGIPTDSDFPMNEIYCPRCHGEGLVGALSQNLGYMEVDCAECDTAVKRFKHLWNSTVKKSDLATYGWGANPWVWVIEFERINPDTEV